VRERFLREAQTAAQLSHPNIVPIFSVDERGGVVYFVMGLVEGETVGQLMKRAPRRPVEEVARVLRGVSEALAYAHRRGVIHRDIKPDNIIVDRASGRPMVTDFGIARAAAADSRLTVTGVAVGTPTYMSPEQALGERETDGRSDVYSLAVVGWHMLAGEPPFTAGNAPALLMKHVSEAPRSVSALRPETPAPLAGAIMRALGKKPEERWKDADAFAEAVAGVGAPGAVATAYAAKTGRHSVPPAPVPPAAPAPPAPPVSSAAAPAGHGLSSQGAPAGPMTAFPPLAAPPPWLSRGEARRWRQEQMREMRRQLKAQRHAPAFEQRPVEERVALFRRKLMGSVTTMGVLVTVNALVSPDFWWCLFPAAFMGMDLVGKAGSLWADGVTMRRVFSRREPSPSTPGAGGAPRAIAADIDRAERLVGLEVLAGPHGPVVRRAVSDHAALADVTAALGDTERAMIPDVTPTANALLERVASLATTLHRIDADGSADSLAELEARLTELRAGGESMGTERERRVALLERQRTSLAELLERRHALASQLESAVLALQNLKLDLLKLRSAGLSAGLDEATTATQQARAVSREIGHAVEAAEDVKKL
jgi:hypothetical protein